MPVLTLLRAAHPGPALAVTVLAGLLGAAVGMGPVEVLLVVAAVGTGQLSIGWSNDLVDAARDRLRPIVRLRTRAADGDWRAALPADARKTPDGCQFELPPSGPEPLLRALIDGGAGIDTLSIERPGLHDAFVDDGFI